MAKTCIDCGDKTGDHVRCYMSVPGPRVHIHTGEPIIPDVAKVPYNFYKFQENVSTGMMEILENGLVTHEIPMNMVKYFKYGVDDFIKYPAYRRRVKHIVGTKRFKS